MATLGCGDEFSGEFIEDDDAAGELGAMIQHALPADGEYTVVATSCDPGATFEYDLTLQCR